MASAFHKRLRRQEPLRLHWTPALSNRGWRLRVVYQVLANHCAARSRIGPIWGQANQKPQSFTFCTRGGAGPEEGGTGVQYSDWLQ